MAYKTAPNIDLQRVDDQMMVLDLTHNAYFSLNETASFLVQKLLEGRTCQDAVLDALEVFDGVTQEILSKDFADTLNELLKLGILIEQDK